MSAPINDADVDAAALLDSALFGPAERHGAIALADLGGESDRPLIVLAAALALWAPLNGHACFDLAAGAEAIVNRLAQRGVVDAIGASADDADATAGELPWPDAATWRAALANSSIVRCVDHATDPAADDGEQPLVLHGDRLYTQRQWADERSVARRLRERAARPPNELDAATQHRLDELLGSTDDGDLQHEAARRALTRAVSVIVGGPGTGKTHTLARALLADRAAGEPGADRRIALAAPTGKAAARIGESLAAAGAAVDLTATTIHRLLGSRPGSRTRFAHDADHRLPHDVVIVDETSMVALPLMARLLEALSDDARLVLVGDPDQLDSVEAGAVLADIVAAAAPAASPMHDAVIRLQRTHRQRQGSPVAAVADAVRDGRVDDVLDLLRGASPAPADHPGADAGELTFVATADVLSTSAQAATRALIAPALARSRAAAASGDAITALDELATVRILCAHRQGPFGVSVWNEAAPRWVDEMTTGQPAPSRHGRRTHEPGRPLLVTRNDARTRLANGDTGAEIVTDSGLRAVFRVGSTLRVLTPAQLQHVETAYATTIHKSQGSEFDTVAVVVPPAASRLSSRELLYTAITRARSRLLVIGAADDIAHAVRTPARRVTGLAAALGD